MHGLQVTTVLALAPLVLIPLLAPRWYERRGTWVCLLARMAWLLNPNQRSARGIAHVLQVGKQSGGGMQRCMQAAAAGSLQLRTLRMWSVLLRVKLAGWPFIHIETMTVPMPMRRRHPRQDS